MRNPSFVLKVFCLLSLNFSVNVYSMLARAQVRGPRLQARQRMLAEHARTGQAHSHLPKQNINLVPARFSSSHTKSECLSAQIVQAKKELSRHDRRFYGSVIVVNAATLTSCFTDLSTALPLMLAGCGAIGVTLMSRIDSLRVESELKELAEAQEREQQANKGRDGGFPDFFPAPRRK